MNANELKRMMLDCEQTPGLSIWEHGLAVQTAYRELCSEFKNGIFEDSILEQLYGLFQPDENSTIDNYQLWHDCGKPQCIIFDTDGRRHFPDHEAISLLVYSQLEGHDPEATWYIANDMKFHTLRGEELEKFCSQPDQRLLNLYYTSWAEIRANAKMFGGPESTSYKIKRKQLIKAGKLLLKGESK